MSTSDLGTFEVVAEPAEVAAFRRAARLDGEGLPFTWPIRWLALPTLRAGAMALMPEPDLVPFHESQAFDYVSPLRIGVAYTLAAAARRETAPDRLVIEATIAASGGAVLARIETVLRLFQARQPAS